MPPRPSCHYDNAHKVIPPVFWEYSLIYIQPSSCFENGSGLYLKKKKKTRVVYCLNPTLIRKFEGKTIQKHLREESLSEGNDIYRINSGPRRSKTFSQNEIERWTQVLYK